jgi:PRTRC genetic system protein A
MKINLPNIFTPIYLKADPDMSWPEHEKVFYLLTKDGSFLCRNHQFFRSSVPTEKLPAELAAHEPFLNLKCPKIPQRLLERIVGLFDIIGERHGAEAAALFVWNTKSKIVEAIVPPQVSVVSSSWKGTPCPIEVHYEVPPLPPHLVLMGDIHCHVDEAAFASHMDKRDETHRPGVHIVVGRIYGEPVEFHVEMVIDGCRFQIDDLSSVAEGYARRRTHEVPQSWIDQVSVTSWSTYSQKHQSRCDSVSDSEKRHLDHWLKDRDATASTVEERPRKSEDVQ